MTEKDREVQPSQTVYILLDQVPLEIAKINDEYHLLSSDLHASFLKKNHKNPAEYRPDILHHCLLNLFDSPLNKAGNLKVYIRTIKNVLISIHPQCRIPRTYSRFAGLMVQLLFKFKIRAENQEITLMKTIKNDFIKQLPIKCPIIALEKNDQIPPVKLWQVLPSFTKSVNAPVCFVIGGFSTGDLVVKDLEISRYVSLSQYGLSAGICCQKICNAYEEFWGIL